MENGSCLGKNVCYAIYCKVCEGVLNIEAEVKKFDPKDPRTKYLGTTGCSINCRSREHKGLFERKNNIVPY